MVLCRLWVLEIATSIEDAALMVLSSITVCGVLVLAVRSAITDLSRYSLELQFSDTILAHIYMTATVLPLSPHMAASSS